MVFHKYKDAKDEAEKIRGIVYKKRHNLFEVAKGYPELAIKVLMAYSSPRGGPTDQCIYEIVPDGQTTYADLDLKIKDCSKMSQKLLSNKNNMAIEFIELLK